MAIFAISDRYCIGRAPDFNTTNVAPAIYTIIVAMVNAKNDREYGVMYSYRDGSAFNKIS